MKIKGRLLQNIVITLFLILVDIYLIYKNIQTQNQITKTQRDVIEAQRVTSEMKNSTIFLKEQLEKSDSNLTKLRQIIESMNVDSIQKEFDEQTKITK